MKEIRILILVVLVAAITSFVWMMFNETNFVEKSEREKEVIDSIRHRYDSLMDRKVDSTAFAMFKKTQEAANRELANARSSNKIFKDEKDTVRVFTDPELDSLLSAVR